MITAIVAWAELDGIHVQVFTSAGEVPEIVLSWDQVGIFTEVLLNGE